MESTLFSPQLLRLQEAPPNPLGSNTLWTVLILLSALMIWAILGKLDIVVVAEGKLVPKSYVKIVQPSEAGIVKEILVEEGQKVKTGQVLMRMDALISEAEGQALKTEFARKTMALRRIDAELSDTPLTLLPDDPPELAQEVSGQYRANCQALKAALDEERSRSEKARQDLLAAEAVKAKLAETLPHYRDQEKSYTKLAKDGLVSRLLASEKERERIEKEKELSSQEHVIGSARAGILQSEKTLEQIVSDYRQKLHTERNEAASTLEKLTQEIAKQNHRQGLLDLKASQEGVVKDLATHTIGTVVQPGTVLLTLVPLEETLMAEVWVSNEDIGFVKPGQRVKVKLAAYPFQKYGMAHGEVFFVSADAADQTASQGAPGTEEKSAPLVYKARVVLDKENLEMDGIHFDLTPGMQLQAEILLGDRTVAEYLLSPVRKAWHEAGRER